MNMAEEMLPRVVKQLLSLLKVNSFTFNKLFDFFSHKRLPISDKLIYIIISILLEVHDLVKNFKDVSDNVPVFFFFLRIFFLHFRDLKFINCEIKVVKVEGS